jgi:hypothetical protein
MAVKTIILRGAGINKERVAAVVITPGYLVDENASGLLKPHSTAGKNASPAFARENEVIGSDITVDYAINDQVLYTVLPPGAEVYALVAASASAIIIGSFLESAGDGTLRIATTDAATDDTQRAAVVGKALVALDNSSGGAEARIKIEVV